MIKKLIYHPVKRQLAKNYLFFLKKFTDIKVIGITGSVGKTTTKEMVASVLSQKYKIRVSYANIDPVYNIPTTILKTTPGTKVLVLEMGVDHKGDMDFYLALSKPDIGILTNIYWTHTEFFGDIEGVAREKGKLIAGLSQKGLAIVNGDDRLVKQISEKTKAKVILYGLGRGCEIKAQDIKVINLQTTFTLNFDQQLIEITLPVLGAHFVYAALAAAAVGLSFNVEPEDIKLGLESFIPTPHRLQPVTTKSGAIILDDTYNSSPLGAKAAIDTLIEVGKGKKTAAVLGDMLELGDYTEKGHQEVGEWVAKKKIDNLICFGQFAPFLVEGARNGGMKNNQIIIVPSENILKKAIKDSLDRNVVMLLKASRKLKFDELVKMAEKL
ncbi:UDP-N-acetylmuramoyl-tripeptide--D-alanyl-D-alanine ligase [Candidatus Microgenomates bacterium]|nr:UDP-N-acetylmuramoyl-tripeptide--D-alanyl-D-alanine ligase [Candidatus Microgenomates bacterium]